MCLHERVSDDQPFPQTDIRTYRFFPTTHNFPSYLHCSHLVPTWCSYYGLIKSASSNYTKIKSLFQCLLFPAILKLPLYDSSKLESWVQLQPDSSMLTISPQEVFRLTFRQSAVVFEILVVQSSFSEMMAPKETSEKGSLEPTLEQQKIILISISKD